VHEALLFDHADSRFEPLGAPVADWTAGLTVGLTRSMHAKDRTCGPLKEEILQQTRGLERQLSGRGGVNAAPLSGLRPCPELPPPPPASGSSRERRQLQGGRVPALLNDLRTLAQRQTSLAKWWY